jgi:hypothetical protein
MIQPLLRLRVLLSIQTRLTTHQPRESSSTRRRAMVASAIRSAYFSQKFREPSRGCQNLGELRDRPPIRVAGPYSTTGDAAPVSQPDHTSAQINYNQHVHPRIRSRRPILRPGQILAYNLRVGSVMPALRTQQSTSNFPHSLVRRVLPTCSNETAPVAFLFGKTHQGAHFSFALDTSWTFPR